MVSVALAAEIIQDPQRFGDHASTWRRHRREVLTPVVPEASCSDADLTRTDAINPLFGRQDREIRQQHVDRAERLAEL